MTAVTLLRKNLFRNRLRTLLTIGAIALPMFVFTIARSFVDLVNVFLEESDKNMRVAVHQKLTYVTPLPQKIRGDIENIAPDGYLTAICSAAWFGGRVEGTQSTFPSMGVDRDTFHMVYSEYEMTDQEIEAFADERRAAVVGTVLAKQLNLEIGDRVTLVGSIPPFPKIEFIVAAIPPALESPWLYFGLDYYDEVYRELTGEPRGVNNFWIKCASPEGRQWALTAIDEHFANSEHETRTEMESTFMAAFAKSGGDWVGMVWAIGQLIVFVAVAVAFNTMSMSFRERTREYALMRALGFQSSKITRIVLLEGTLLGLIGGSLVVVPLYALTSAFDLSIPGMNFPIKISTTTFIVAMLVSLLCGILAAILPAIMAGRLRIAHALRKVV